MARDDGGAVEAGVSPGEGPAPWRHLVRLALLLAVAGLLIPDAGVHRTTISLTKVESAKSVDFADGVVWLLVLGSDARPGTPLDKGTRTPSSWSGSTCSPGGPPGSASPGTPTSTSPATTGAWTGSTRP